MSRLTDAHVALAKEIIGRYPRPKSALVPLLHLAQEQDGYITRDAMVHIGELVGVTSAEVYGTATFYEMFKFEPVGKYVVNICGTMSCALMGSVDSDNDSSPASMALRCTPPDTRRVRA